MAYHIDRNDEDAIVFDGIENGVAESPYNGISDMRNVNIISIPGEASVNFSTSKVSAPSFANIAVSSADAGADTITFTSTPTLEIGQAVVFTGASLPTGITAGTFYWIATKPSSTTATLSTRPDLGDTVNITATGTGTFSTIDMNIPKAFAYDSSSRDITYLVDKLGHVWYNGNLTASTNSWVFTGNKVPTAADTNGNGLVYYQSTDSNSTGYIFVIHNSSIDYATSTNGNLIWNYQWTPGVDYVAPGTYNATPTAILKTALGTKNSHEAIVAFC